MPNHIANRDALIRALRRELVGPAPSGPALPALDFENGRDAYRSWTTADGQEILNRDRPSKRYGVGVLYPLQVVADEQASIQGPADTVETSSPVEVERAISDDARRALDESAAKASGTDGSDEFDLSLANAFRPSSIGISFLARVLPGAELYLRFSGARYEPFAVTVAGTPRTWWKRIPVSGWAAFALEAAAAAPRVLHQSRGEINGLRNDQRITLELRSRPTGDAGATLVTACIVNRTATNGALDEFAIFQTTLSGSVCINGESKAHILPYPSRLSLDMDEDDEQAALLYKDARTFAIGHGCAPDWSELENGCVREVRAEVLPTVELPSITTDVVDARGQRLEVRMDVLAGLTGAQNTEPALRPVVDAYEHWVQQQRGRLTAIPERIRATAERNLVDCETALSRMREGLAALQRDALSRRAFQLSNHAMLLQQLRHPTREPRLPELSRANGTWSFPEPYEPPSTENIPSEKGRWRAFQIAFLLMNVAAIANPQHEDREHVELIWFPTGGGKTEAYLGLAAFSIFLRRLRALAARREDENAGVQVLMRYTLRLLTTQQFQRAAALLCSMEYLRSSAPTELGRTPFGIAMWVGGTPNSREQARSALRSLKRGESDPDHDVLVLEKCPWCRARMGTVKRPGRGRGASIDVLGYTQRSAHGPETVIVHCPDRACHFHNALPVQFIDEDIYDPRVPAPSLLIGTVDKFAMLAWKPDARRIFGRDAGGAISVSPPELILQDELHLISGPLGSMVGLYECVIDELCTDRRTQMVKPKVVTSTATIRGYREQVRGVFGREAVTLFPPPGLSASDSFFASYEKNPDGSLARGRLYAGVNAPGLGSAQTVQVRVFTALLQAVQQLPENERDPWWTLLAFYNSLRELGGALTLFQSDIPEYFDAFRQREGRTWNEIRRLREVQELTGRLDNADVRSALSALERSVGSETPAVDACLASNIIEVGVDVDRMSLLAVVGQPKTTAQYIQVTGRVGRRWWERPGLIVTLYSASKPRDRSHFEKFRSYHERLYSQVEPSSVTPFSSPALQRALHAAMIAYVRQTGPSGLEPHPVPEDLLARVREIVEARADIVDQSEREESLRTLEKRVRQWTDWAPLYWSRTRDAEDNVPLMRRPGEHAPADVRLVSWEVPMSMRNVDAECDAVISKLYTATGDGNVNE